jgi:O-antigen/teichoic acid export membrane protein
LTLPSLILVSFVILAAAPELTRVMLGAEYWSASQFIVWGVIAELARVASGVYGMIAHARMKTKLLIFPSIVGASLSILLIWLLMPRYASNGVGAALMLSSVTAFVLTYVATHKEYKTTFSHITLIKSVLMGIGLILLAEFLRSILNINKGVASTLTQLLVLGGGFLYFQYILLKPLLKVNLINE